MLRDIRRRRPFVPVTVAENLTWEQFSKLNVALPDLAGVQPDVGASRFYEYGVSLAHVVGYVSAVSEKELTGDPLLELPGFRVGKNGVEKVFDEGLRGRAGYRGGRLDVSFDPAHQGGHGAARGPRSSTVVAIRASWNSRFKRPLSFSRRSIKASRAAAVPTRARARAAVRRTCQRGWDK